LGVCGGYNIGRVWHDDIGSGFWINILDSISAQLGLFTSKESTQFTFGLGVSF